MDDKKETKGRTKRRGAEMTKEEEETRSQWRARIYHENMQRVYHAIVHHPLLMRLVSVVKETRETSVCFLDMQNIFRHCPVKDFQDIHRDFKSDSEALFQQRKNYLLLQGIHSQKIEHAVLQHYRPKDESPTPLSFINKINKINEINEINEMEEKNTTISSSLLSTSSISSVVWILVSQKNMTGVSDPILDVVDVGKVSGKKMYILFVGCYFWNSNGEFTNCSQSKWLKNEMDDYALLLLATQFLSSCTFPHNPHNHHDPHLSFHPHHFPPPNNPYSLPTSSSSLSSITRFPSLYIFSNDNFHKKSEMVVLQHHRETVHFYHFHPTTGG